MDKCTGLAIGGHVHARWMLETGDAAVEVVAREAGFGSALSLRQHFRAALQTSPAAYRKAFRDNAPHPA
jgi:transcriptional regulator GlxA family with amidase domain